MRRHGTAAGSLALVVAITAACAPLADTLDTLSPHQPSSQLARRRHAARTVRTVRPLPTRPDRDAPTGMADSASIGVLTINLQHRDDTARLRALAASLGSRSEPHAPEDAARPDFILCQEVVFDRGSRAYDDTAAIIAAQLGYFSRGSRRPSDREGVAIVSRYAFEHYDDLHLRARTATVLLGFRRVSAMGEFRVPGVGRVRVVNVHLAHWPFEEHVREQQLRETLRWVARRQRRAPADITILGGDFNAEVGSPTLQLLHRPGVTGSLEYCDYNSMRPTMGSVAGRRIDHLFIATAGPDLRMTGEALLFGDGVATLDGRAMFRPSDHLGVMHRYSVRRPSRSHDAPSVSASRRSAPREREPSTTTAAVPGGTAAARRSPSRVLVRDRPPSPRAPSADP